MANLQKHRAHESLNMDSAADWQVQSAVTADTDGVAVNVSSYQTIHLQSDNDFYFTFNTTGTDSDVSTLRDSCVLCFCKFAILFSYCCGLPCGARMLPIQTCY